ncbi:VWA domain-containing protein [Pseudoprimorskyibacter insulae]|uniref:VWFA domain-containing protein n=1 Tax=Pseudoprimorskyibacter insulae TaxID=1695997 RepID=A0A2R8AXL5_9RHOB|nr:VWA domain-containing protein [Pseudoprimorskyibacter insulae]SPF80776.1 hypothetical protein PRI8871_02588 [Pseudoprimorskyibacter insulae]
MKRTAISALAFAVATLPAFAQEAPNTMLVLDASGSMWGQIDGVNKITIARTVLDDLLATLPENQNLGLTVYGHRTKGDCSDIETLVMPAPGNRADIAAKVAGLNPKGKTPLSAAVIEAARALRHTEEAATVILISDGIETCEADPCAVGAELEASGVNFTAHVVGFDVADPVAQAQLQCLARNTGGTYLPAKNARELSDALATVTKVVEPTPVKIGFSASETFGTATRAVDVVWEIYADSGDIVMDATQTDSGTITLPAGSYVVKALRLSDETQLEKAVTLTDTDKTVHLDFDEPLPEVTLGAPDSGPAGTVVQVTWDGPNGDGDYLDTAVPGAESGQYLTYTYTMDGNPAALRLPAQPGIYDIRYIAADGLQVLATRPVTVTEHQAALSAPASVQIGAVFAVVWQGAGQAGDYLDIALPGAAPLDYVSYAYVADGNPLQIKAPVTPGEYQIRYIVDQDSSVFASIPLTITDVPATLIAPAEATAGQPVTIAWTGPGNAGDWLTITTPDDGPLGYVTYGYTNDGNPLTFNAPDTPGSYVIRYIADGPESRVLTEVPLVVK